MNIFIPCTLTLAYIFIERIILKRKYPAYFYLFILMIILILFNMSCGHSREPNEENKIYESSLSKQQRDLFFYLCEKNIQDGYQHINNAEEQSIFIPNFEHRQLTKDVIRNLITTLPITDLRVKTVAVSIMFLSTYLEGVYDAWEAIEYELNESKYNFEMAEFYQDLLFYDNLIQSQKTEF